MKSRLLAGVVAVVLAVVGALLVFTYAQNADARAVAGMEPVDVLVVQKPIPAGTKTADLRELLAVESLPGSAVADGALKNLKAAAGMVTSVDLLAGEQLLTKRLIDPKDAEDAGAVKVPKGLLEVSVLLEPQRVVGGNVAPGDRVGVNISYEEGPPDGVPTTQYVFHKVLLTNVQKAPTTSEEGTEPDSAALPTGSLILTVAVDDAKSARIVHGSEFGTLWLTKEPADATESENEVISTTEVYE